MPWLILFALLAGSLGPIARAQAGQLLAERTARLAGVTAFDLIIAMNTLRVSYGHPALLEDPTVNAVAQATAEYMAANHMSWHIGDVKGRLAAAGYGGGAQVWATENFAVASNWGIDEIMQAWSDEAHMLPATNPAYCHVGAGVAKADNGRIYYVLQAAYISGKACASYTSPPGGGKSGGASQWIVPVKIATPDADGNIYHVVEPGQSFWAIAVAYKITIRDLEIWNNLSRDSKLQIGQRLFIPGPNTKGYATPTPIGMIVPNTPDPEGKIVHIVHAYQTLFTIAQAYKVPIDTILNLNGIQADWPLQIGQELIIKPSNLSPIEKLTPESDGKYYHTVKSGETLSWIAKLYAIKLSELMAWNGLNATSIIRPGQKLLLLVTPPPTKTPIPSSATITPTSVSATSTPLKAVSSPTPVLGATSLPVTLEVSEQGGSGRVPPLWWISIGLLIGGVLLVYVLFQKRQ